MTPTEQGEATGPPYEPQVIFYEDRDEFEFVSEDTPTVSHELSPGVTILLRMSDRQPIGFYVARSLIDAARRPVPQPLQVTEGELLAEAERVLTGVITARDPPAFVAARALLTRIKEHNNG